MALPHQRGVEMVSHTISSSSSRYIEGTAGTPSYAPIFISYSECQEDAKQLADMLMQRHGAEVTMFTEIGPVIGSHAGPGTLAIFFIGKHR